MTFDGSRVDFAKGDGLVPVVVQHADDRRVLMLGYMNAEALAETQIRERVVFFSRSRQCLWEKGETSGHTLELVSIALDCDADTLLVQARPRGPVCHTGTATCFEPEPTRSPYDFLGALEAVIGERQRAGAEESYTQTLFAGGIRRMAQKVGEEGVEVALAAVAQDDRSLVSEAADLVFHLAVLLRARNLSLTDVVRELEGRHDAKT